METVFHPAKERGIGEHGWLHARYSFSFASYFDPKRLQFGVLRVLNNDIIDPGAGFGTHAHDNMEIITLPLSGALAHKDSIGNSSVIETGEVQVMSAGTGVEHSEFNASKTEPIELLQIWIFPNAHNVAPRYGQKAYDLEKMRNNFELIVGPVGSGALEIHQNAYLSLAQIELGGELPYRMHRSGNGAYFFLVEGEIKISGQVLQAKDALGVSDIQEITVEALKSSRLLVIEAPMR